MLVRCRLNTFMRITDPDPEQWNFHFTPKMHLPIMFPLSPLCYYHLQVISNASADHVSVISFMLLSSTGHLKCICRSCFRYLLYAIIIYRSSQMHLPIIFPLSPLCYYHLQVISNASADHISVISFMLLSSTGHLKCICRSYFRYLLYAIIIYRSSQMHLPIIFPLSPLCYYHLQVI